MAKTLPISTTSNILLPVRTNLVKSMGLCASAANSVIEFFDGTIDAVATFTILEGGSGYALGDIITLETGEFGGTQASFKVTQVDHSSPSSSVSSSVSLSPSSSRSSSPSSSISSSPSESESASHSPSSSASGTASNSPSTSISSSISASASPSTSISSSISSSISTSVSNSISTSISTSPSVSESISSSISASPSTSISSSISGSLSPSAGAGFITGIELVNAGGGYTAGNNYDVDSTDGDGTNAQITVDTVTDVGTSIGKLACVANESAAPIMLDCGIHTTNGVSARISGSAAKGHITYE